MAGERLRSDNAQSNCGNEHFAVSPIARPAQHGINTMEHVVQLHIEKLPEGLYLATSDMVQGLVAQGRTIQEAVEIARDVAKKLIEAQWRDDSPALPPAPLDAFDYPLIVVT